MNGSQIGKAWVSPCRICDRNGIYPLIGVVGVQEETFLEVINSIISIVVKYKGSRATRILLLSLDK